MPDGRGDLGAVLARLDVDSRWVDGSLFVAGCTNGDAGDDSRFNDDARFNDEMEEILYKM
jgi:hypothetical protein